MKPNTSSWRSIIDILAVKLINKEVRNILPISGNKGGAGTTNFIDVTRMGKGRP